MAALHLGSEGYSTDGVNGSVGIGTSSPTCPLDIVGRSFVRGANGGGGGFWLSDADAPTSGISFIGRGDNSEDHVGFYSNGAWRLVIDDGGNVGIGTTSPAAKLHVNSVLRLESQASAPCGGLGDMYIDTSGNLHVHNGTAWRTCQYT